MHRPPEGQGRNGVMRAQLQTEFNLIHDFNKIICHAGISILQAV